MRIGCVSDVCLGYGSPQVGLLAESLTGFYGAETLMVEPRIPTLPPQQSAHPAFQIRRARTVFDPYSSAGRTEYILDAARILDEWQPDLLVVYCTFSLPVLFKLRKRPARVIYFCYESISHYGPFDELINRQLAGMVDVVVFPEKNRAALELGRYRFGHVPVVVMYNCSARRAAGPAAPREARNGRILYAGRIDPVETLAEFYTKPEVKAHSIDLYGPITTAPGRDGAGFREALEKNVYYGGRLESRELSELRRRYIYSLVVWNPRTENQLYAAPNKLFESIADGVPPIAAPHPQCKEIIETHECGVLLDDWTGDAFVRGLERAARLYRTRRWEELVANCESAVRNELNWERQFEKLKAHLT